MKLVTRVFVPIALLGLFAIPFIIGLKTGNASGGPRTYVGQESCMQSGCHADKYGDGSSYSGAADFRETFHQKIHLRPTPQTVVIDSWFAADSTVKWYQAGYHDTLLVHLSKGAGPNEYFAQIELTPSGQTTPKMKVEYTYGGNGWMQRYLVKINGQYCVLPFQYVFPNAEYKNRTDKGGGIWCLDIFRWVGRDGSANRDTLIPWNTNAFRKLAWDVNCAACHVNGYGVNVIPMGGTDTSYQALWVGVNSGDSALQDQNMKIGCESCHGPGSEHIANPSDTNIVSPKHWGKSKAAVDMKYDLCNQCHTRVTSKGSGTTGLYAYPYIEATGKTFVPGVPNDPLTNYITSVFGAARVWGDNQTSYSHHQQGQDVLRSIPYGKIAWKDACWSCHEVHKNGPNGLPYQLKENFYSMKSGEGCITCHEGYQDTAYSNCLKRVVNKHSMHLQSESQCVNCHFPKVAHLGFYFGPEFTVHQFGTLRPSMTINPAYRNSITGMPNVCASACHRNGRGNRNSKPTDPEAPSYGITDIGIDNWKETSDIALADSLWTHYQVLYEECKRAAVREAGSVALSTSILSIQPNPATDLTTIRFGVGRAGDVKLEIFDAEGKLVRILIYGRKEAGVYRQEWNGTNDFGGVVPNGVYMIRLRSEQGTSSQKVIINR